MDKKLFGELTESMTQMGEIVRGERAPSREFHVTQPSEAIVTVNGARLSSAQVMTIRVFLSMFEMPDLGDDEHGKVMTDVYNKSRQEILLLMRLP